MKLFATVFGAVLLAGLIVYQVYRRDQALDVAAREWDVSSEKTALSLERATEVALAGDPADLLSLKHHLMRAELELSDKPSRTHSRKLDNAYRDASEDIRRLEADRASKVAERDKWRAQSRSEASEIQRLQIQISTLRDQKNAATGDAENARLAAEIVKQSNALQEAISRERVARIKADDLEKSLSGR